MTPNNTRPSNTPNNTQMKRSVNSGNFQLYKLVVAMMFSFPTAPIVILVGGFVGRQISPLPALATLPIALTVVGTVSGIIPANLLMQKIGRKKSFVFASFYSIAASLIAVFSISQSLFWLFLISTFMLGGGIAFVHQYRFAAVELLPSNKSQIAISRILIGGIVGGILGPYLANISVNLLSVEFAGCFLILAIMHLLAFCVLLTYKHPTIKKDFSDQKTKRSLLEIIKQPLCIVAILTAAFGYALMSLLMTAAPLSMKHSHNFDLSAVTFVIQIHLASMFVPSLFSGAVLQKIGAFRFIIIGFLFNIASYITGYVTDYSSQKFFGFLVSLFCLGIGWNFLFVGGTYLLTKTYRAEERFKVQAFNDFFIFGIQALASLSSGLLLYYSNWAFLNQIAFFVLIAVASFFLFRQKEIRAI